MLLPLILASVLASSPKAAVREFYAAYASGNVDRAERFWVESQRPAFRRAHERLMGVRCRTMTVVGMTVANDRVDVEAIATASLPSGATRTTPHHGIVIVRRNAHGMWQIAQWRIAEEELADRWLALNDTRARAALLHEAQELRTPALVDALCRRAVTLTNRGEPALVPELIDAADAVAEEWDDDVSRALVEGTRSVYHAFVLARWDDAVRYAQNAIAIAERSGDPDALVRALWRLGRATDDEEVSTAALQRALGLAVELEDVSFAANAASELTHHENVRRHFKEALNYAFTAVRYARMSDAPVAKYNASLNLAETYAEQGGYELAIAHYQDALAVARAEHYDGSEYQIRFFLAWSHWQLGHTDELFRLTDEAMAILGDRKCGDPAPLVFSQRVLAHLQQGHLTAAERDAETAVRLGEECSEPYMLAEPLTVRAQLHLARGRWREAAADAERAIERNGGSIGAMVVLSRVLRAEGRVDEARAKLETLLDAYETQREAVADPQLRHRYLSHNAEAYRELVDLLADMHDPAAALLAAERLKARVLRDIRGAPRASLLAEATGEERRQARALEAELEAANTALLASRAGARERLTRARLALEDFEARMRARGHPDREGGTRAAGRHERGAARTAGSLADARDDIWRAPPADVVVLEYIVGEQRTIIFTITRGADGAPSIKQTIVAVTAPELRRRVDSWLRLLSRRSSSYASEARALYDLLVAPAVGSIAGKTLCIIPDGELWRIPFHALKTRDGRHVIERHAVVYAPSYAMLEEERHPGTARPTLLAFGNPRIGAATQSAVRSWYRDAPLGALPEAEEEVRAIARLYGDRARVHIGSAATEETLKRDSTRFRILHFATHGLLDAGAPLFSSIVLAASASEDGLLEAREIANLDLDADLAILSACDTARGELAAGEGIFGLSWALMATGCPRMIGTQWRVSSAATAELMIAFHRRLSKRRTVERVADDLRAAQLEMIRGGTWSHPYYWAGVVLIGCDW